MEILLAQTSTQSGSGLLGFVPIILIGLVFYLLILRPQTKQRKQHEQTLANLKKGDRIITRGGLYGKIINFQGKDESKVVIDAGSDIKLNISRSYINSLEHNSENVKPDENG